MLHFNFRSGKKEKSAKEYRECAAMHMNAVKTSMGVFLQTGVVMVATVVTMIALGCAWFVSNTQVGGASATVSAAGQADFALATMGAKEQGAYDSLFGLSGDLTTETIGGTDYYIASGNSSFRVSSDKNLNNYLANADLRPGNRGSFDLYVICRTDNRYLVLNPVFSAWHEKEDKSNIITYQNAFSSEVSEEVRTAAEFLKGHILLFANMDDKGMYSGNIDLTKKIELDLSEKEAFQTDGVQFPWGEFVYQDQEVGTAVYRLSVYWVWPEQFGNFIYTGNSYNKNLFADKDSTDYNYFLSAMESNTDYKKFFFIKGEVDRPLINTITSPIADYKEATKNYELYSGWYNAADEEIGLWISYIELGFEIVQED